MDPSVWNAILAAWVSKSTVLEFVVCQHILKKLPTSKCGTRPNIAVDKMTPQSTAVNGMFRQIKERLKFGSRWFTLPIHAGPLRGLKWIAFSGKNFLRGTYEPDKTEAVLACVKEGDTAWDIGGHVGYYAILESKLVGQRGQVFVFEPRPLNAAYIKRHMKLNNIENVTLIESAVSDQPGIARFESRTGTGTGHLSCDGNLQVETVTVDELVEQFDYSPPDFIKLDVEGAEVEALNGALRTIERFRPRMVLATHDDQKHEFVVELLRRLDYEFEVLENAGADVEIVALPRAV